jgi:repressor LexA
MKPSDRKALQFIRNRLVHFAQQTTVRELAKEMGLASPNAAAAIIQRLIQEGYLERGETGRGLRLLKEPDVAPNRDMTVCVPLVGSAACGMPLLAEQNITAQLHVSTQLAKPPGQYFFLRAQGDSMNTARIPIQDKDLVLVKAQPTAHDGQQVVALINDEATIKEIRHYPGMVTLLPRSTNSIHQPIVLADDFQVQGVVIAALPAAALDEVEEDL